MTGPGNRPALLGPVALLSALLAAPAPTAAAGAGEGAGERIVLGETEPSATGREEKIRPLTAYLAGELEDLGVVEGDFVIPRDSSTLVRNLRDGMVDVVFDSPYPTLTYIRDAGARPILMGVHSGLKEYHSNIFVRADSGIREVGDLVGKVIAFRDRSSTSEFVLPLLTLRSSGLELAAIESSDSPVPAGKAGYLFAGSELNIATWVFYGKVDAGAFSSSLWGLQDVNPEAYRREFSVIMESPSVPRLIVSVRGDLDGKIVSRVRSELLKMHENPAGRSALRAYNLDSFSESSAEALASFEKLLLRFADGEAP